MKSAVILAALALVLAGPSLAKTGEPEKCPAPAAIQAAGFTLGKTYKEHGLWIILGKGDNQYDTKDHWSFAVSQIPAANKPEAYEKAVKSLATLAFDRGPESVRLDDVERYACGYTTAEGYAAFAITPAWSGFFSR